MTIWRQNKVRKSRDTATDRFDVLAADPFEMEDHFDVKDQKISSEFTVPSATKGAPVFQRSLRSIMVYGSLFVGMSAVGFGVAKVRPWTYWSTQDLVYAYFEVRAVDQAGRPIAGAAVKNAGKKVGTTDSFGEWRRYMKVPLGSTVPITIAKGTGSSILYATKNFAVPPTKPAKNDMELRASVQLIATTGQGRPAAEPKEAAAPVSQDVSQGAKGQADETLVGVPTETGGADKVVNAEEATKRDVQAAAIPATDASAAKIPQGFVSTHETIWFEAMGSGSSVLSKEVLPALVQRSKELGLRLDPKADWRIRLTGLIDRPAAMGSDGGGLILVSSFDKAQPAAYEFLRNYQSDARVTARGILYVLSHGVRKNIAVVKKNDRWLAVLPKASSQIWKLAPGMSFSSSSGQVWPSDSPLGNDASMQGVYLRTADKAEGPCDISKSVCELSLRSFAEVPPVPTWIKIKAKTQINTKDQVKIFVSGYEARPLSDNVVEYWGQDRAKANVTVVHAGRVVHRAQIMNDSKSPATIAVSTAALSKR